MIEHSRLNSSTIFYLNYLFEENQFFIIIIDKNNNEIILNQYQYKNLNLIHTIKNYKPDIELKKINYCSLTYKSKYLLIADSLSVSVIDMNSMQVVVKIDENVSNFKLSGQFQPVIGTDDFILQSNNKKTQNLVISYLDILPKF